jgi:hypothetical protein
LVTVAQNFAASGSRPLENATYKAQLEHAAAEADLMSGDNVQQRMAEISTAMTTSVRFLGEFDEDEDEEERSSFNQRCYEDAAGALPDRLLDC